VLGFLQFIYDLISLIKGPKAVRDVWDDDPTKPKDIIIGTLEPEVRRRGYAIDQPSKVVSPEGTSAVTKDRDES
jgi:hypothetical protein